MINGKIDFRSDTVTVPTEEMRKAMASAVVGDDVYGDDATINELERLAAEIFGKESALFVPTGTMANQLALFTHVQRGEEVILPDNCHIIAHEAGASAIIAGAQLRSVPNVKGEMSLDLVEHYIRKDPDDIHQPRTALISYENADSDGQVRSLEYMKQVKVLAEKYQLPVYVDGARIFNAATYLNVDVKDMVQYTDTISVCLSKGLCAPAGSLLMGSKEFITKARRKRKILGGGMRQVGILAAAGILALKEMSRRLQEDHDNAKYLCTSLKEVEGLEVYEERQQINMVFFRLKDFPMDSATLVKYMAEHDVRINGEDNGMMRFVTHNYVSKEEIDKVVQLLKDAR
ncbi:MAG: low-specificity L-threonine aldolase [Anaerotignum propionicum]|uniref:low-specificity L-threonine aldolase n=1 Tax=Anaerotignum propionicum TaxID=28446 RepID=UPI002B2028D1|nr:low-specificity L-threonine aldolase [Anaerotignum propionicum]MEA5056761.1 low-specificity L-threonine aldolase [Anaerotignum propionicum]